LIFSKSCIYGIRATLYLATQSDKELIPIRDISKEFHISFHFLTKIFQQLTAAGLVRSVKGPKGGIALNKPVNEINSFDIIDALDGKEKFHECVLALPGCNDLNPCSLHAVWSKTIEELKEELKSNSLQAMADSITSGELRIQDINTLQSK